MNFDYSKLKGKIIEIYDSQAKFSNAIGLSERSISLKLTGKRNWTQNEISKIIELLEIDKREIGLYFFNEGVQKIEQEER